MEDYFSQLGAMNLPLSANVSQSLFFKKYIVSIYAQLTFIFNNASVLDGRVVYRVPGIEAICLEKSLKIIWKVWIILLCPKDKVNLEQPSLHNRQEKAISHLNYLQWRI